MSVQPATNGIANVFAPSQPIGTVYYLNSTLARTDAKGIVIENGKKVLRR